MPVVPEREAAIKAYGPMPSPATPYDVDRRELFINGWLARATPPADPAAELVHGFAVYHWGCNEDDELGIVLQPSEEDATSDPFGIFPTKEQAENAMERNWPGGEVRRVRIVEDPEEAA